MPHAASADPSLAESLDLSASLTGVLHANVAFDWGEEIDLGRAESLVPAQRYELPRRRRTPASIGYQPPPLRFALSPVVLQLPELGQVEAAAEATLFDFAAVSVALRIPFTLPATRLSLLAAGLADSAAVVRAARAASEPLHTRLLPAIDQPVWSELSEEYFVFELPPGGPIPAPEVLTRTRPDWLASLVRLEADPLSTAEVAEALRMQISYSPQDLLVLEWAAAVLIDQDCEETLETIEFANMQLLEFRHTDGRLDRQLAEAYRLIHPLSRSWLPFWKTHMRPLRKLGDLKIEANSVFDRTGNVLKLVGDQYLARVYRMLAARFHLGEWEQNIRHSLEVVEGVYQVLSDQAATFRTEFLEVIVIGLIALEIVLAFWRH